MLHVAYQTSGNIAVGDDEVIRYVSLMQKVTGYFDEMGGKKTDQDKYAEIIRFLKDEKKPGDMDTRDVLYIKAQIRREEALSACRYMGMQPEKVHFLDLPFYETGKAQKGN